MVDLQQNLVKISVFIPFSVTPQAKTAFFISISLTAMYIISGTAVLMDFSAEIFARTGSSISSKSSSLLVSVTKLTGNLIFLVVVEKLRRKVCFYAFEFSRVTFHGFLVNIFRLFTLDQHLRQLFFSCYLAHIAHYGCIDRSSIGCPPFVLHALVLAVEQAYHKCHFSFPLKSFRKRCINDFCLNVCSFHFFVSISDSIHMYFVYPLFLVVDFVCYRIHISHSSRTHRIGWMLVHFRNNKFIKCNTRQLHNSRNSRQII